jgi:oxygen-independent coproporphyrinogen-3 oxidase
VNNFCYIHIPFCTSKCKYCRFASFWILDKIKINLYIEKLINEIQNNKTDFKKLKSVYFGWWTPSILDIEYLDLILKTLKSKFWFDDNIEINIEATPSTITFENINLWKSVWINRISMWVQTLNNKSLIEIWRDNKWSILTALDNIKEVWFENISIDFIIGLPYVKKWEINKNIDYILWNYNFIKHISVYMLEEYYDIPDSLESNFDNIVYPNNWNDLWLSDSDFLEEYISIKNNLNNYWFDRYEISNFAKKWYESIHNRSYWNHLNVLWFWLWGLSFINNIRYSNSENFIDYYSWKNIEKEILTKADLFIEEVMFQLRTDWLSKSNIEKLNNSKIEYFIDEKYLIKKSDKIYLPDKWVLVMDYILSEII